MLQKGKIGKVWKLDFVELTIWNASTNLKILLQIGTKGFTRYFPAQLHRNLSQIGCANLCPFRNSCFWFYYLRIFCAGRCLIHNHDQMIPVWYESRANLLFFILGFMFGFGSPIVFTHKPGVLNVRGEISAGNSKYWMSVRPGR